MGVRICEFVDEEERERGAFYYYYLSFSAAFDEGEINKEMLW